LVEAEPAATAAWFYPRSDQCPREIVQGSFEELLARLPPLTSPHPMRALFVRSGRIWTAHFHNGREGGNVDLLAESASEKLDCRAAGVDVTADTWRAGGREGVPGGTTLSLFELGERVRTIYAIRDGDRWEFDQWGDPLPFEEVERYGERRIRDRFTPEMAERYMRAWAGIRIFDADFYAPDGRGILLHWQKPKPTVVESLEEAQSRR
jgi:hypothetical protein